VEFLVLTVVSCSDFFAEYIGKWSPERYCTANMMSAVVV